MNLQLNFYIPTAASVSLPEHMAGDGWSHDVDPHGLALEAMLLTLASMEAGLSDVSTALILVTTWCLVHTLLG